MKLIGFTAPRYMGSSSKWTGGFVIPIYGSIEAPYCVAGREKVDGFCTVNLKPSAILLLPPCQAEIDLKVGAERVAGFESRDGTLIFAGYDAVAARVRSEFERFADFPFTQSEMASFLGDEALFAQVQQRIVALMNRERAGAGDRFAINNPFRARALVE